MFAILSSVCRSHPNIQCSSQSNGNIGKLKYYVDDGYKGDYSEYHQYGDKYNWNYVSGSFCPHQSGMTEVKAQGYPSLKAKFIDEETESIGDRCSGTKTKTWNVQLYAHRCYPFSIGDYTNCLFGNWLDGYINGTKINSGSATIMDCYTTDCLPGYYTDTCEKAVDAYCNEHGTPEYGRTSDGMGCVCNSYGDNIFCEDTSKYTFDAGKRGVRFSSYYSPDKIDYSETYSDFSYKEFGESYATVEISSKIFVSQNTYLQFELGSVPYAQLYVDGNLVAGYLSDQFSCEEKVFTRIQSQKKFYSRGNHLVTIKINSGCAMYVQAYELKWKFFRWYRNNPPAEYEPIPQRYLGLP